MREVIPFAPSGSIVSVDPALIGFCLAFSMGLGLVCSIYPALKSARLSPMEAIREEWQ
jgi:ABC-type antimicrobial peptide transport system permease subunit